MMKGIISKIRLHHIALIIISALVLFPYISGINNASDLCGCFEHKYITQYDGKGTTPDSQEDKFISFLQKGKNHFYYSRRDSYIGKIYNPVALENKTDFYSSKVFYLSQFTSKNATVYLASPISYLICQLLC